MTAYSNHEAPSRHQSSLLNDSRYYFPALQLGGIFASLPYPDIRLDTCTIITSLHQHIT